MTRVSIEFEPNATKDGIGRVTWKTDDDSDYGNNACWYPGIPAEKSNGLYHLVANPETVIVGGEFFWERWETMAEEYGFPELDLDTDGDRVCYDFGLRS